MGPVFVRSGLTFGSVWSGRRFVIVVLWVSLSGEYIDGMDAARLLWIGWNAKRQGARSVNLLNKKLVMIARAGREESNHVGCRYCYVNRIYDLCSLQFDLWSVWSERGLRILFYRRLLSQRSMQSVLFDIYENKETRSRLVRFIILICDLCGL